MPRASEYACPCHPKWSLDNFVSAPPPGVHCLGTMNAPEPSAAAATDDDLLRRYADQQDQQAFATLASRYVNFVYSTAARQVRDRHLAEDVTQAVFIVLLQKAGRIRPGTILSNWL